MGKAYGDFWRHLLTWNDTATRTQYWWPTIINYLASGIIIALVEHWLGHPLGEIHSWHDLFADNTFLTITMIVWIGTFTLKARRLHDTNRSAWWMLINLIPFIGSIWWFVLMVLPSKRPTRWG